jgi:hypothetical protein
MEEGGAAKTKEVVRRDPARTGTVNNFPVKAFIGNSILGFEGKKG